MLEFSFFLNKIFIFFVLFFSLFVGIFILVSGKRNKVNQFFFLIALSTVGWIVFRFFCNFTKENLIACLWCRFNLLALNFFLLFLYFFSLSFPKKRKSYLFVDILVISIFAFFLFTSLFTNSLIKEVAKTQWGNEIKKGPLFNFFLCFIFFIGLLIFFRLIKDYFSFSEIEKLKAQYFLIGSFLFLVSVLIFNIFLPLYKEILKHYQFGHYSVIFFLFFVALSIKRKLLKIRLVLIGLLVGFTLSLLILQIYLSKEESSLFVWSIFLFLIFLIIGSLLLGSVLRETKQKEELERSLSEVKRFTLTLDERVKKRTYELQKRIQELEKFYNLTIKRELKMVRLKEKIRELEEKLSKFEKKA